MTTTLKWLALASAVLFAMPLASVQADGCAAPAAKTRAPSDIVDTAIGAGSFQTLVAAVQAAELVETLRGDGPFTVFAPTDAAFAKLPEGTIPALLADRVALRSILTYHVVAGKVTAENLVGQKFVKTVNGQSLNVTISGDEARIDGARILKTDILAKNGIIHVVDAVMLPRKNLVEMADAAGTFKTLLAAAKAAGLVDVLTGEGPFTVFAPSDAAFAKLPEGTVEALLKNVEALRTILTYHVIPGRVLSSDLPMEALSVKTANGQSVSVVRSAGGVRLNDASTVVKADILAGNGVIHVVDAVILPN